MRVAQHISRYAVAHRCSWLPKCSGLNATRHRATRRDTRISLSRDQHDPRDNAPDGKHDASAHANHDPKQGIGVRPVRYLLPRLPASRRWSEGSHSDRRNRVSMTRHSGANFTTYTDCDLVTNRSPTRDRDARPCLDRRHGQYLDQYLTQGMSTYRCHHQIQNHVPSRRHSTRAHPVPSRAVYLTQREQTDTARDLHAACAPVCNAIVTELVGRVAYPTTPDAPSAVWMKVLDAVEPQTIGCMQAPATPSAMLTVGHRVCTTAGPQVPRHADTKAVAPVVNRVRTPAVAWTSHEMGKRIDRDVAGTGLQRIDATIQDAVWRAV